MNHKNWCEKQKGCISLGSKPCTMCKQAFNAALSHIQTEITIIINEINNSPLSNLPKVKKWSQKLTQLSKNN